MNEKLICVLSLSLFVYIFCIIWEVSVVKKLKYVINYTHIRHISIFI